MFRSLFRKPLELRIADQLLVFDSAEDFEFALSGRADVPGTHVGVLMTMDSDALSAEMQEIHAEERHLVDYFGQSLSDPEELEQRFEAFQTDRVRTDHHWLDILSGLKHAPQRYYELKRTAVIRYLQYLNARACFIEEIVEARPPGPEAKPPVAQPDIATEPPGVLDGLDQGLASRLQPLPQGVRTLVLDTDEARVCLMFATNPVSIYRQPELTFDDDQTESWLLAPGTTVVGRGESCDIMLHRLLKDISREHATVEVDERSAVWITDTSSHGTFLVDGEPGED